MKEITFYGKFKVEIEWIEPKNIPNDGIVTSTFSLPVLKNDRTKLLLTKNPRGWDYIGGHVETGESPEEAMIRESKEEGCISVGKNYHLLGAIKVDNLEWKEVDFKYPKISYLYFYYVEDFILEEFQENFECKDRKFVPIEELPKVLHNYRKTDAKVIEYLSNHITTLK